MICAQPHEIVVIRDHDVQNKFAEWGAKPAGPAAAVLLIVTAGEQSAFDEGRVAERLALAARACGLGSCIATLKNGEVRVVGDKNNQARDRQEEH